MPWSEVAEVVMAVDVAVAAMAHGRGRGWGGAELCGRGGAVGGGGAGNLRSARDARQPPGHGGDGCAVGGGRKKSFFYLERGRKGAGRTSVRVFFYLSCGTHIAFYHKRIHPFGWITWLYYFRATVDALTKRSKRR